MHKSMRSIFAIVLLSLLACGHANDSTENVLADKLADRLVDRVSTKQEDLQRIMEWSLGYDPLDDTMHAKPVAKTARTPGARTGEPTSYWTAFSTFQSPFLLSPWRSSSQQAPEAAVQQKADIPLLRLPLKEGLGNADGLTGQGSEYLGRLAPFPGILPEIPTLSPEEAAAQEAAQISIAGLTPAATPRRNYTSSTAKKTLRFRIHKDEGRAQPTKIVRAPINVTCEQVLSQYAGPGSWELHLCNSENGKPLDPDARLRDLGAEEPELKLVRPEANAIAQPKLSAFAAFMAKRREAEAKRMQEADDFWDPTSESDAEPNALQNIPSEEAVAAAPARRIRNIDSELDQDIRNDAREKALVH